MSLEAASLPFSEMSFSSLVIAAALTILAMMLSVWLASVVRTDASLVDRFWGFGFVLVALVGSILGAGFEPRRWLVLALAGLWGLRLTIYLTVRNWGEGEDRRYVKMRQYWGEKRFPWISLFTVFLFQGLLMWLVALPLVAAQSAREPASWTWLDGLGIAVWAFGLAFEAIGDWQLRRFKQDPANRGQVMNRGLWRYTRHPNYFGDAVVWWGLFLIASQTPLGWLTVVSPLVMSFLLMKVSGVPMTERRLERTREGYAEYKRRTNAFFPGPPKKAA